MRPSLLFGAFTLLLTIAPAAGEGCTPTTSDPEVDTAPNNIGVDTDGDGWADRFYVDNDLCQPECLFAIWIYQESNGIDGLQRRDEMKDDTCQGAIDADTLPCQLLPIALLTPRRRERSAAGAATGVAGLVLAGVALAPTAEAC